MKYRLQYDDTDKPTYGINLVFSSLCTHAGRCRTLRMLPQLCRNPRTSLEIHRSRIPAHRPGSRAPDPPGDHGSIQNKDKIYTLNAALL